MAASYITDGLWTKAAVHLIVKILNNKWVLRVHPRLSPSILFVSSKLCIKLTGFATLAQADAMRFVAEHTSIPVPKVYCSFEHKGLVYILMERLPGRMLIDGWLARSEESKARILAQLKGMIQELRSIPPPDNVAGVCNVNGGPIFDMRLPDKLYWGPFATIYDFHRELRNGTEAFHTNSPGQERFPDMARLIAFHDQAGFRPVFTHGDLSSLNILADGDKVTGIIDWETAGWMPPYWEYATAWHVNPSNPFWREEVDGFLEPMVHELDMEKIRRRYFGEFGIDM
ncbi:kinase-like protein [Peniophora sp. CONT]|nr:kinase-like protein [Peniophora sp. CONT]